MTNRESFVAGMTYVAGPKRTTEILQDPATKTDVDLILDQLDTADPLGFTPAERLMFDHGIDPR